MDIINLAAIAPNYDNVGGLTLITSLTAGGKAFIAVKTAGEYNRGQKKTKANGVPDRNGFKSDQWTSGFVTLPQWALLASTYEGEVTISTLIDSYTYVNCNAILEVGEQTDFEKGDVVGYGWSLIDFVWKFSNLRVIP